MGQLRASCRVYFHSLSHRWWPISCRVKLFLVKINVRKTAEGEFVERGFECSQVA